MSTLVFPGTHYAIPFYVTEDVKLPCCLSNLSKVRAEAGSSPQTIRHLLTTLCPFLSWF